MANIAKLPDGIAIIGNPQLAGRYGPPDRGLVSAIVVGSTEPAAALLSDKVGPQRIRDNGTNVRAFRTRTALAVPAQVK